MFTAIYFHEKLSSTKVTEINRQKISNRFIVTQFSCLFSSMIGIDGIYIINKWIVFKNIYVLHIHVIVQNCK